MKRRNSPQELIASLWAPEAIEHLTQSFGAMAAHALTNITGPVRSRRSEELANQIVAHSSRSHDPIRLVRRIQRASLKLSHPRYMAQQVAAPIPLAVLVESVVSAMNQSLAVWEMSPIATAIDRDLMARFRRLFRLPNSADGSLVPGGAFGNLTALLTARESLARREAKGEVAVIVGALSHYSIARAASVLGMSRTAIFTVPVDRNFRTEASALDQAFVSAKRAGFRRFIVVGSAGCTPTGSFDDLPALRRFAMRERAWLHVDAAHGAAMAFSRKYAHLVAGLGTADSITFDPHKMMFMPLTAGGVLVRNGRHLLQALEADAPYLFGSERRWPDIGQRTIACSQRFDALKTWIVWRSYGPRVWDALVTQSCDVCRAAFEYCVRSGLLEALHEPESNILCFRVRRTAGKSADLLHWKIKEELNESGYGYLSCTTLAGRRVLRLVIMNPRTRATDVHEVLGRVERMAKVRSSRSSMRQKHGKERKDPPASTRMKGAR